MVEKLEAYFDAQLLIAWSTKLVLAVAIYILGRWLAKMFVRLMRKALVHSKMDQMLVDFVGSILSALLFVVVLIAALNQLGVDTTSLVALVGAAGLAVGLALQSSLSNFAAGVMLILFKPFKLGDFVEAGGASGVVEQISIFNTIMKTVDNKQVIVPNGQIYAGVITNYSAKELRRVDIIFGVGYHDDLLKAKTILGQLLEQDERILKDPAPLIAVAELADSSVNINVRPWVKSEHYGAVYADLLERVKLSFDQQGISIPYPQTDVHLHKTQS